MSTNLGPDLPDHLVQLLSGEELAAKVGLAFLLTTVGEDGYPHPCIVTPGELVAQSPGLLRLAVYEGSTASRNLRARPTATLSLAHRGAAYYLKVAAASFPIADPALEGQAVFTLQPQQVLEDREANAEVTSGFTFRDLRGQDAVLRRWAPMVGALRATFLG